MVRVAGLRRQVAAGVSAAPPDGLTPHEQLDAIDAALRELLAVQRRCLDELLAELARTAFVLVAIDRSRRRASGARSTSTSSRRSSRCSRRSRSIPAIPFPYISNLSLSLAVGIRDPTDGSSLRARESAEESAALGAGHRPSDDFVPLEQVIGANLGALFPGYNR